MSPVGMFEHIYGNSTGNLQASLLYDKDEFFNDVQKGGKEAEGRVKKY